MKTAMIWRTAVLGAVLSAVGGVPMHEGPVQVLWAIPAAKADDSLNATSAGAGAGTAVSASAHASASVTTTASGQGCVAESSAEATAQAGDQQKSSSDHKRVAKESGPCRASSGANAVAGPPPDTTTKE
jgi:hypothetical protein